MKQKTHSFTARKPFTRSRNEILEDRKNSEALEKLYKHNELDFQLYEYVKHSMFSMYQREYGHTTENDIDEFKKLNKMFTFNKAKVQIFRIAKYMFYENMFHLRS